MIDGEAFGTALVTMIKVFVARRVGEINARVDAVQRSAGDLASRVSALETALGMIENRVAALEAAADSVT